MWITLGWSAISQDEKLRNSLSLSWFGLSERARAFRNLCCRHDHLPAWERIWGRASALSSLNIVFTSTKLKPPSPWVEEVFLGIVKVNLI